MAGPTVTAYNAGVGQPIYAGYWPGGRLSGGVLLDNTTPAGGLLTQQSMLSGVVQLDSVAPVGTVQGYITPAWMVGKPLNEWFTIPGTSGAGGAAATAFSGMALRDDTSEIYVAAAGGHNDSSDNRVVSLDLRQDAPTWVLRIAPSTSVQIDVPYYADGKPSSRHTYHTAHWVAGRNRVMLSGSPATYGSPSYFDDVVGFNVTTNTWDAANTFANVPVSSYGAARDNNGNILSVLGWRKWSQATDTYSALMSPPGNETTQVRFPWAYDSSRDQWFGLAWADGQGFTSWGSTLRAVKISNTGLTQVSVTFNSSAALTQLAADQPVYAGMVYDVGNDRFLFYASGAGRQSTIYVVTPNAGTTWDVSILSLGGGSVTPTTVDVAGILGRFRYVPQLNGVVALTTIAANLYFMRLS